MSKSADNAAIHIGFGDAITLHNGTLALTANRMHDDEGAG